VKRRTKQFGRLQAAATNPKFTGRAQAAGGWPTFARLALAKMGKIFAIPAPAAHWFELS